MELAAVVGAEHRVIEEVLVFFDVDFSEAVLVKLYNIKSGTVPGEQTLSRKSS